MEGLRIDRIYHKDTGITYIYQAQSIYDPVTKRTSSKRKLIGKEDPITHEVIPTGPRGRPRTRGDQSIGKRTPESEDDKMKKMASENAILRLENERLKETIADIVRAATKWDTH